MIEIRDLDIDSVESELSLTFDESRRLAITTYNDIQACPGSGKTTVVAAKLLILSKKWNKNHQGICVLTHTNVAKEEIITRLEANKEGSKLLSYPHFIGTIQEFVNRFLAMPYMRSNGLKIHHIDDELCCQKGWGLLNYGTRAYLQRRNIENLSGLQYTFSGQNLVLNVPTFPRGSNSASYQNLVSVKRQLLESGYFYFQEMYAYAQQYLFSTPSVINGIRSRFPCVLIDEMQDTQKYQDELLNQLFADRSVCYQRFGDPDQAIYSGAGEENETYNSVNMERVQDSHRFNNSIAALAKNLSYNRIDLSSATNVGDESNHTIFLVDENSRQFVFRSFAELCASVIPEGDTGKIKTVGAVGTKKEEGLTICHYLETFDKSSSGNAFNPSKFIHYLFEGRRKNSYHEAYGLILDGLVRLGRKTNTELQISEQAPSPFSRSSIRRYLRERNQTINFNNLVKRLIVEELSQGVWLDLTSRLFAILGLRTTAQERDFICFEEENLDESNFAPSSLLNKVIHEIDGRIIENEVTTIHAVKGETHSATLVLETKFHQNDMTTLIKYILNQEVRQPTGARKVKFMKQLYVACTRPRHLLCLAVSKAGFPEDLIGEVQYAGWKILDLTNQAETSSM